MDDAIAEDTEDFTVNISSSNASVANPTVTMHIEDDDGMCPNFEYGLSLSFIHVLTALYVGILPPPFHEVKENDGEVFVCVGVFETHPLLSNMRVYITTTFGNAIGMLTHERLLLDHRQNAPIPHL